MLAAYVISTIVGGVLLVASLVGGHHDGDGGGGDAGGDHGGGDHGPGGEHAHEAGHEAHGSAPHDSGASVATVLLSIRFWTYLLAFGGATGLLIRLFAHGGEPLALLLAAGVGGASGVTAQTVMKRLGSARGGTVGDNELVGRPGRLLLPAGPGKSGRVRLTVRNQSVDLIAQTDDAELPAQSDVLVIDVKDGVAQVTKNPAREE